MLGAGILWFGWFGFNGGSAGGATPQAVQAFVTTQVAAACAGLVWSLIEWLMHGRPTMLGMITGAVAGLVAITPAAGFVEVGPALIIGGVASIICFFFVALVKPMVGYDDALDVFGVHGIGGIWGAIATGIFAMPGFGVGRAGGWWLHWLALLAVSLATCMTDSVCGIRPPITRSGKAVCETGSYSATNRILGPISISQTVC